MRSASDSPARNSRKQQAPRLLLQSVARNRRKEPPDAYVELPVYPRLERTPPLVVKEAEGLIAGWCILAGVVFVVVLVAVTWLREAVQR